MNKLRAYCSSHNGLAISPTDLFQTYTQSYEYLIYTTAYHHEDGVPQFTYAMLDYPAKTIIDVGCCSGISGLQFALYGGYEVTFLDFEGVGLDFIRWFVDEQGLDNVTVSSYGQEKGQLFDLVLAFDVLEHTGNHLGAIRWLSEMGRRVAICYPFAEFEPPYIGVIDEWIDDEAIGQVIEARYKSITAYSRNGRRFRIWDVE